jgi:hypothetical protein
LAANTYAAAGRYTFSVQIVDAGGSTVTVQGTAQVRRRGEAVDADQVAEADFWRGRNGQALIKSFNGGRNATALGNWLATTFANLYGAGAGVKNLTGKTNAQVAAFYLSRFRRHRPKLGVQLLATALNVYATTRSLGGLNGRAYGFRVGAFGLGASSYNVGDNGAAFGVAHQTTLNVYQILKAANRQARNGVLYGGDRPRMGKAYDVFEGINEDDSDEAEVN